MTAMAPDKKSPITLSDHVITAKLTVETGETSEAELKEIHQHIAEMFGINPRTRTLAA